MRRSTRKIQGRFSEFDLVGGIYKITNKITGNCYIGKSKDIRKRFKAHIQEMRRGYRSNKKWAEDIRLYGIEVFEYELLEHIPSKEEFYMATAEREWVQRIKPQYNRYFPTMPVSRWCHEIVKYERKEQCHAESK